MPGSSLEVVEPEFFLQLLVSLLTDPARLDGAGEHRDRRVGGKVGEVVFVLASSATFADQPGFVSGHMLATHVANAMCGPSATRTRTAAKRADGRPLVPRRQPTERQDVPASIASAAIDLRETETPATMPGLSNTLQRVGCLDHGRSGGFCYPPRKTQRTKRP